MAGAGQLATIPPFPCCPATLDPTPLLAVSGLSLERDGLPVFGPLSFGLDAGQLLCVRGGNGAGKTSLLRVLAGFTRAGAGSLSLDGHPATPASRGRYVAYLGHHDGLKADLGCLANLEASCGLLGRRARQTPHGALGIVGLAGLEKAPVRRLSAGQRRRLALARLWLSPAPLWLLDEPYANLDGAGIDLVNRMLAAHLRAGGAAVLTSHGEHNAPFLPHAVLDLVPAGADVEAAA